MRRERIAVVAVLGFLATLLHTRSLMFFLGLDTPAPDEQFFEYWNLVAQAHVVGIVWIAIFLFSYTLLRQPAAAISGLLPKMSRLPSTRSILAICIGLTALGVVSSAYLIFSQESISGFVYAVKVQKALAGLYVVRHISILGSICCLIGLMAAARPVDDPSSRRLRSIPMPAVATFLFLIAVNLATNYMWGNRFNIAMFLAAGALTYHFYIRRISMLELLVIVVVSAVALQSLRIVRELLVAFDRKYEIVYLHTSFVRHMSYSLHFVEFDGFMLALRDAGERFDFRMGQDFWNGIVSWIPRQIWEAKPGTFHVGQWFRQVYEPERINGWPVTVIGSWYVNFGYIGVFIGAIISGTIVSAVDQKYDSVSVNPWHAVVASIFGFFLFDGGVNTGFPQYIVLFVMPIMFLSWLTRFGSSRAIVPAKEGGFSMN